MLAVAGAGFIAGAVNAVVGSGSLVTFPMLLAVGYPPVTANVSNSVGLVFGNVSAAWGYRRELAARGGGRSRSRPARRLGALVGGILLLTLPGSVFDAVVPVLILLACRADGVQAGNERSTVPRRARSRAPRHRRRGPASTAATSAPRRA